MLGLALQQGFQQVLEQELEVYNFLEVVGKNEVHAEETYVENDVVGNDEDLASYDVDLALYDVVENDVDLELYDEVENDVEAPYGEDDVEEHDEELNDEEVHGVEEHDEELHDVGVRAVRVDAFFNI